MQAKIASTGTKRCQRSCNFYNKHGRCTGCTYQHIWEVIQKSIRRLDEQDITVAVLKDVDDKVYRHGSNGARGIGGRVSVDKFLRDSLGQRLGIGFIDSGHSEFKVQGGQIRIKHDGHFRVRQRNIFVEYKGYPEEGQILASMMAAKLLKDNYEGAEFYLLVHSREWWKEHLRGASRLLDVYQGYIDGVFGLDCLEEFIRVAMP